MTSIVTFFIPFLLEMFFGKKHNKTILTKTQVFKRKIVYGIIMFSFCLNYFVINKLYNLSLRYIFINNQKTLLELKAQANDSDKIKHSFIQKSLEECLKNNTVKPVTTTIVISNDAKV